MKEYLGDGVYIEVWGDCGALRITTEDGISVTNEIVFEPETTEALLKYLKKILKSR